MIKNDFNDLLQREMDRRQFLKNVGVGIVALTGVATVLKTLNGFGAPTAKRTGGYGASAYGGPQVTR